MPVVFDSIVESGTDEPAVCRYSVFRGTWHKPNISSIFSDPIRTICPQPISRVGLFSPRWGLRHCGDTRSPSPTHRGPTSEAWRRYSGTCFSPFFCSRCLTTLTVYRLVETVLMFCVCALFLSPGVNHTCELLCFPPAPRPI